MLDWLGSESIDRPVLISMISIILLPIMVLLVVRYFGQRSLHRPVASRIIRKHQRITGRDIFFTVVLVAVIIEVLIDYRHPAFDDWTDELIFLITLPLVIGYWLYFVDKPEQERKRHERPEPDVCRQDKVDNREE